MQSKRWLIKPPAPPERLLQYSGPRAILEQILYNRALLAATDAERFLTASADDANPLLMKGMNEAVQRIRYAIRRREKVIVYGDFDADGVTSTALLVQALRGLGAQVQAYIPNRIDEGYGLNSPALLSLARQGVKLVITVDCGIRSVQEVEDGKSYGLDLIVTDHHTPGPEIPNALAVINPKQSDCRYGEDMLAGVGIAYRLAQALYTVAQKLDKRWTPPLNVEDLLDLVAIGTVADLAPMNRLENRSLVLDGLLRLNEAKRPGVRALLKVAGVQPGMVSASTIGFALGPRINAAGRLASARTAYELLTTTDLQAADELANQLQSLNVQRQDLTREAQARMREKIDQTDTADLPIIFAADENLREGIVGLVAGRLAEEFYRPAIVMHRGEHESRASCRSIPEFDITHALDACADLLVRHGGHAQAAGFTVLNENLPALQERLLGLARKTLEGRDLRPAIEIDAEVEAGLVNGELLEELKRLEPTGHHNPLPILVTRGLRVHEFRVVGKGDEHLKLRLSRPGQIALDAIAFRLGEWAKTMPPVIDLAYQLEVNDFNGNRTLQLNVLDLQQAERR